MVKNRGIVLSITFNQCIDFPIKLIVAILNTIVTIISEKKRCSEFFSEFYEADVAYLRGLMLFFL